MYVLIWLFDMLHYDIRYADIQEIRGFSEKPDRLLFRLGNSMPSSYFFYGAYNFTTFICALTEKDNNVQILKVRSTDG